MKHPQQWQVAGVLALFAGVFVGLSVYSCTRTSATYDEPNHLVAGYAMLKNHDYRFTPEHVPLTRMWAAIPLVCMRHVSFDPSVVLSTDSFDWVSRREWAVAHQFLYQWNDADHLLYAARFMMTLLGVALGILVFCWAYELYGYWPAVVALSLYALEPNILAHSSLITPDIGLACFVFGAAWFLWRTMRRLSLGNVAGLSLFSALAVVSKSWGMLLLPLALFCLLIRALDRTPLPYDIGSVSSLSSAAHKFLGVIVVSFTILMTAYMGIWAAYGFRYRPSPAVPEQFHFDQRDYVRAKALGLAAGLSWIDQRHLLPNAYTQGLICLGALIQKRPAFLAGRYSDAGWWYYFPVALLIKTPVILLLLSLVGATVCARHWRASWRDDLPLLLVPLAFLSVAMCSKVNIGVRYLLLVFPFATLLAAKTVAECLKRRWRWVPLVVVVIAACELASAYPHCLVFFNCFVGGPSHGHQYLVDSNLDWGQDLKGLKRWMDRNKVNRVNLSYFGTADPEYYHINCTYLPGGPSFAQERTERKLELPGYVAISVTNLRGVYLDYHELYRALLDRKPLATIGHSIHVYWVDKLWDIQGESAKAHLDIGRALLAMGCVDEAISHLRKALEIQPDYGEAHNNLGLALLKKGRVEDAILQFRETIRIIPGHAEALNNLGWALANQKHYAEAIECYQAALKAKPDYVEAHSNLGAAFAINRQTDEAVSQYQEAILLKPDDAEVYNNLGIALGNKGQIDEAIRQFQEAIRLKPDDAEAHYNLGITLVRKGEIDEAISQFREAIRLKPDDAGARKNLRNALLKKGQTDEAIK